MIWLLEKGSLCRKVTSVAIRQDFERFLQKLRKSSEGALTFFYERLLGQAVFEVSLSRGRDKVAIENLIAAPVSLFAYPNGKPGVDYGPRDVELVKKAGFAAAVSTIGGVAGRSSDIFQLPRFGPWDRNPRRLAARLFLGCVRAVPA
jgi:hypothetical protein